MFLKQSLVISLLLGSSSLVIAPVVDAKPIPAIPAQTISQASSTEALDFLKLLDTVPVFGLMDENGEPLLARGEANNKTFRQAIFWLDPKDAAETLEKVVKEEPQLAGNVHVRPLALGQVLMFAESQEMLSDWRLKIIPKEQDLAAARAILALEKNAENAQFNDVPVFFATTGSELLIVEYEGEKIIPLFMSKADLQVALLKLVRVDPSVPRQVKIDCAPLEAVLAFLSDPKAEPLKEPVIFVPNWQAEQAAEFLAPEQ